jgi:enamine deaminase RidA (YjgF/YER057c/UK114 family)
MTEPSGAGTPHRLVNPPSLLPPEGFSHAVVPAEGRTVYLGGQAGHRADGTLPDDLVEQFDQALANVVEALSAAGGRPEDLVSIHIYVTDAPAYRSALGPMGRAWRRHLGRHYPAVSLFEVSGLFDPEALVEIVGVAVVPGTDS